MPEPPEPPAGQPSPTSTARHSGTSLRSVGFASFIGTAIEWYDFFLYGSAAALVFNRVFFPPNEEFIGTLVAFGTFAAGYVARPVGAAVFGRLGDRIGRKTGLVVTLSMMGAATFLIGLIPSYAAIGVAAPILLLLLRLVQGIAVGGEWGGAVLMAVEHAPGHRRGLLGSLPQLGAPAGLLLSTGMLSLFALLPEPSFLDWGWRVPFLLSAVLLAVGMFVRVRLAESPEFTRVKESGKQARTPVLDVLRRPRAVLLAAGLRCVEGIPSSIYAFFTSTYVVQQLNRPESVGSTGTAIAAAVGLLVIPTTGALSDRFGRRRVFVVFAVYSAMAAFPIFWLMGTGQTGWIWLALVLGLALGVYGVYGPMAAYTAELFGASVRYSGASIGYQLGGAVFTGFSPLIATTLLAWTGNAVWPIPTLIVGSAIVSVVVAALADPRQPID